MIWTAYFRLLADFAKSNKHDLILLVSSFALFVREIFNMANSKKKKTTKSLVWRAKLIPACMYSGETVCTMLSINTKHVHY